MDGADLAIWTERLTIALKAYPAAAALEAIDRWPQSQDGQWLPAERELTQDAERIAAAHRAALERVRAAERDARTGTGEPVYMTPLGASADYVEAVRRAFGKPYADSWLAGGVNCRFRAHAVLTTAVGADRLKSDTSGLAAKYGVAIVFDPASSDLLAGYVERVMIDSPAPRRKPRMYGGD
jgi:hypothetical protein